LRLKLSDLGAENLKKKVENTCLKYSTKNVKWNMANFVETPRVVL